MEFTILKTALERVGRMMRPAEERVAEALAERDVPMVQEALRLTSSAIAKGSAGSSVGGSVEGDVRIPKLKRFKSPAVRPSGTELERLHTSLKLTAQAEADALAKLPARLRAQYEELAGLISFRADGRMALRQMLLDGRLTAPSRFEDNKHVLNQLSLISRMDVVEGMNKRTYLAEVVQELNNPNLVCQETKGTCAATTARSMLIRHDAAEYLRLQRGLISESGVARLREDNGAISANEKRVLVRKEDWLAEDGGRTISARVQDPAAMQYAYEKHSYRYIYDNDMDLKILPTGPDPNLDGGLMNHELHHLLKGYFPGTRWEQFSLPETGKAQATKDLMVKIGRLATPEKPVTVGIDYPNRGAHQLAVTGVVKDKVIFYNPSTPSVESMPLKDFRKRIIDAVLPKSKQAS